MLDPEPPPNGLDITGIQSGGRGRNHQSLPRVNERTTPQYSCMVLTNEMV
ncbi:hypothetical protein NSERUTF1_4046 [Nocardia seriolae]|nr:hypothetical protein NSERUTF1_4046 [Nocardia seriolae]